VAQLRHPNIVQMYDFDMAGDQYYMVMEYVNGPTLKDELKARRAQNKAFSQTEATRIFCDLASAVGYAHEQGLVHRDLKPANVMLSDRGQIVLTDFGIVQIAGATRYTMTGTAVGTPSYMAPEQGKGERGDARSDIYSLSIMLYELFTGQVPFDADTAFAIVMKHVTTPPPPPRSVNPDIPEAVEQVIMKGLHKEPGDRYASAGEMASALRLAIGLAPGDTLSANPLAVIAPRPRPKEFDKTTVLPASTGSSPTAGGYGTPAPHHTPAPTAVAPPPAKQGTSPLVWVLAAVILLALIGAGIFALGVFDKSPPASAVDETSATEVVAVAPQVDTAATQTWLAGDDDRDRLSNEEEINLNTLPGKRDTDEDGLDDGDEVLDHNTDPLRPDSDGDGLKDGDEVRRGLNPLNPDSDDDGIPDAQDEHPIEKPTPTPPPTNTPPPLPTDTAAPLPTDTPPPLPTATPAPAATATKSGGNSPVSNTGGLAKTGSFITFESPINWRRGDEANGTFTRSNAKAHSGSYAGQLNYNFSTAGSDYVVFLNTQSLGGRPNQITAWVYGDGKGAYLNVWVKDNAGQTWQFSFGQIKHTGWKEMRAILDPDQPWPAGHIDGSDNGKVDFPISFRGLILDDAPDSFSGSGVIYIDDLSSSDEPIVVAPITETETIAGTPTPALAGGLSGQLAFEISRVDGTNMHPGVYLMDLKTMEPSQLTGFAGTPHISRKGGKVAWKRSDTPGLDWIDMTGNWDRTQLTFDPGDRDPNISNSQTRMAYVNAAGLYVWENAIAKLLVSGDSHPSWDPDDNWLVYGYSGGIYKVLITQLEPVKIGVGEQPDWGPDRRIVFAQQGDIFIMDENGNAKKQLTDHAANDYDPTWSPDGSKILFVSERDGNAELYIISPSGTGLKRLTNTPYWETSPSWGR